ncbi:MAG TPA: hypothetical protein VGC41_28370 [Kofleriaceae bacterium]
MSRWGVIAAVLVTACASDPPAISTSLVTEHQSGALLSAWGSSSSDVWTVGGGALVFHLKDGAWTPVDPQITGIDLWWVFGFAGGDVFMSGSGGTILRYHGGAIEKMATPAADGIIFGMWGPTADDVWAVGRAGAQGAILWHYDGTTWTTVAPPSELPPGAIAFKVHGQRSDDVWVACSGGGTLHWDGSAFTYSEIGDPASLFGIVTIPGTAIASGDVTQLGAGALFENRGSGWQAASLQAPVAWRGLGAGANQVYAVGEEGLLAQRDDNGAWTLIKQTLTQQSFHAVWVDPDGGMWGVGGEFGSTPTRDGFLMYRGTSDVPALSP